MSTFAVCIVRRKAPIFTGMAHAALRKQGFALLDVSSQEQALAELARMVAEDAVDANVRAAAVKITRDCKDRDDICELTAIFDALRTGDSRVPGLGRGLKYMADNFHVDQYWSPARLLQEIKRGNSAGDCLPLDTLVLGAGYVLRPIGEVRAGDVIMGDGKWVEVTQFLDKGVQSLLSFSLSNKCTLRCTPEHRLFRVVKRKSKNNSQFYAGSRDEVEEVRASEVRPGDDLLTADRLPMGREDLGEDRAKLLGLFIADGWAQFEKDGIASRASIAGKDGKRKEAQKEWVRDACARLGAETRWHERYIGINNRPLSAWLGAAGHLAQNKHVPSLDLNESSVNALLEGLSADADVRNNCFGTISSTLAVQLRVLYRMLGRKTSIKLVENHGGLGKHPIYRVQPWSGDKEDLKMRGEHARVRSVAEEESAATCDISVEGQRFYLPETDLIVHNCDDHALFAAALAASIGFRVGLRAWGRKGSREFQHVYAIALVPKEAPESETYEFGLDTSADVGDPHAGWQPEEGRVLTALIEESDYGRTAT